MNSPMLANANNDESRKGGLARIRVREDRTMDYVSHPYCRDGYRYREQQIISLGEAKHAMVWLARRFGNWVVGG